MKNLVLLIFVLSIYSCTDYIGAGTLGGIGENYIFPVSKNKLEAAIGSLYSKYPKYKVPENWKQFDDWSARGYDFLESHIFYISSGPEEMYYVSFIGDEGSWKADSSKISIAIRAVKVGDSGWLLGNELNSKERKRISARFESQLILKLERILKKKSWKE
jgi:hypothetical protein